MQIGGEPRPVQVHVDRDRGGRRAIRQPGLLAADGCQVQAATAELRRHRRDEVAGGLQLVEVFLEKAVVAVVSRGALAAALEKRRRQRWRGAFGYCHGCSSSLSTAPSHDTSVFQSAK